MIFGQQRWVVVWLAIIFCQSTIWAQSQDEAVSLDQNQTTSQFPDLEGSYGKLRVSGFGVGAYEYVGNTNDNSFKADKVAISAFEQVNSQLYFFGQLTTALEEEATGIEIDNLILSYTPAGLPGLTILGGKFDAPVGFERDDEPLNFQASNSFNFELGRPVKYSGVQVMYTLNPTWSLTGYVVNGWNLDVDNNKAKTVGTRLGFSPGELSNLGLSFVLGFPKENDDRRVRVLTNVDYTLQTGRNWVVAGEINLGREEGAGENGQTADWFGGQLTSYYQATNRLGLALRYDVFRDADGARTGLTQTLQSFSIGPSWKLKRSQYGAYSVREHTTFGIPQFEIRLEFRVNHSNQPFFEDLDESLDRWETRTEIQTVIVF